MPVGAYSIVQYIADPERDEAINVGLVLAVDREVHLEFVDRSDAVRDAVERFHGLLKQLVESEYAPTAISGVAILEDLTDRRFSSFRLVGPRPVDVPESKAAETLEDLLGRLVASHEPSFR